MKKKTRVTTNYVNNEDFYKELLKYRKQCETAIRNSQDIPRIPNYIGECIYLISNKLSNVGNFCNYSYKDEMIADGIEDCIKGIHSFNIEKARYDLLDYSSGSRIQIVSSSDIHKVLEEIDKYMNKENCVARGTLHSIFHEKFSGSYDVVVDGKTLTINMSRNPFSYFTQACYFAFIRRIKKEKKQKTIKSEMIRNSGILDMIGSETQDTDDGMYENSYRSFLLESVDVVKTDAEKEQDSRKVFKKTTKAHQKRIKDKEEEVQKQMERESWEKEIPEENEPDVDIVPTFILYHDGDFE